MKNDTYRCDTFDKHNGFIIEFKPCEIAKQFDVNINMGDCTCPSSIPHCQPCPPCDTNCCDNNSLLILLVALVIRDLNLTPCITNCCNNNSLLMLLVALIIRDLNFNCGED